MTLIKDKIILTLSYELEIIPETGEILKTTLINRSVNKPIKEDSEIEPKLYLEDNKCRLNNAAINLMQVNIGDKIDIRYEGNDSLPIIGTDKSFGNLGGCKLTKTNTFLCKGTKRSELARHGNEFIIKKHPNKNNIFILENIDIEFQKEKSKEDELDLDLESLISNEDNETEINSNFFKF